MRTPSRQLGLVVVAVLVVTAGCLSGPIGVESESLETTDSPGTNTTIPDSTTESTDESSGLSVHDVNAAAAPDLRKTLPEPVDCAEQGWVGWWGTNDVQSLWGQGNLHLGWTVPANQSTLFVAFENTTAVGTDHAQFDSGVTADGAAIEIENTTGEGQYAVVMMLDVNGNGEYDPGTDRPCRNDDSDDGNGIVMTSWLWVDWNATD